MNKFMSINLILLMKLIFCLTKMKLSKAKEKKIKKNVLPYAYSK